MTNQEKQLNEKPPTDCYACWLSDEDHTDGEFCYELKDSIRWFRQRRFRPLNCPLVEKLIDRKV